MRLLFHTVPVLFRTALLFISAIACALIPLGCTSKPKNVVTIRFVVSVPKPLEAGESVYISGNLEQVGSWSGEGLLLRPQRNGTYAGAIDLPRGGVLEYKVTRGSWDTVEKSADGSEIANRVVQLDRDRTESIRVGSWSGSGDTAIPPPPPPQSTVTGDVRYHRKFRSLNLGNERTLTVWLPPGYEGDPSARYPVLYMHDGQNLFDDATSFAGEWHADETAAELIAQKRIVPIIIVGIENAGSARVDEYTPTRKPVRDSDATTQAMAQPATHPVAMEGGNAEAYARFLIEEVKPFIDANYRTMPQREHTAVAGSSLGGLVSLYLGWKHGDVFGKVAAVSPSLWWDKQRMLIAFESDNAWMRREKIWFDMGTDEGSGVNPQQNIRNTRELHAILARAGRHEGIDFVYQEYEGARHNEQAWSQRFDQILIFLFRPQS